MKDNKFTVVSLFSGAMGLDIGIQRSGSYKLLACLEKEKVFCETIRANIEAGNLEPDIQIYEGDIKTHSPTEIMQHLKLKPGELDLLIGGPPCQSFSTAGKRGTVQDPRGSLLWSYLDFVKVFKPKFFLMENVRGLISAATKHRPIASRPDKGGKALRAEEQPGSVIKSFSDDLQEIDGESYHLDIFEVNAVNYGAPQIRERVIFIGNRFNIQFEFPLPDHFPLDQPSTDKQLTLFEDDEAASKKYWLTLGDVIKDLPKTPIEVMDFSPRKKGFLAMVPPGSNWRSLPIETQKESMGKAWFAKGGRSGWWRRLTFELPCPTLVTMPNHASTALCHPIETRALSIQEYKRIQEFPDNWVVCGTTSQKYAQIGNAVPTRLGEVAGRALAKQLTQVYLNKLKIKSSKPLTFRIVYLQSHIRTRKWFKDGKVFVWDSEEVQDCQYGSLKTKRKERSI